MQKKKKKTVLHLRKIYVCWCMFISIRVYTYIYISICVYLYENICMHACMYVYMNVCGISRFVSVYAWVCIDVHMGVGGCMRV
jgi:hypothetical protein